MDVLGEPIAELARLIGRADFVAVLTGAGMSTASGIPDYRSPGTGLWQKVDPKKVSNIAAFLRDPREFWSFYPTRLSALRAAEPNPAHRALARLEAAGHIHGLITQNIDGLHRRAGSSNIVEVHGSVEHFECLRCRRGYPFSWVEEALALPDGIPSCECGFVLKPGVVFFGEDLPRDAFSQAIDWVKKADLLLVAGSSLEVWPVAGLVELATSYRGRVAIVNATATGFDADACFVLHARVEDVLPRAADLLGA